MKHIVYLFLLLILPGGSKAQQDIFNAVYPIGDHPNIGYKTSMAPEKEVILFEANPVLRMPIYNNIRSRLMNTRLKQTASTLYFNFRPQLRMYTDNSLPVKTPSYRISILGYQQLFRLQPTAKGKDQFLSFSVESGHYSNGQTKCAFDANVDDGSPACDSVYDALNDRSRLSDRLNRESGNFSTNYTEILLNYRLYPKLDEDHKPLSGLSFTAGVNYFHDRLLLVLPDIGGYSDGDIKIYGKYRFMLSTEGFSAIDSASWFSNKMCIDRLSLKVQMEYISRPHASVNPLRLELMATAYFQNHVGIFLSGIYGHDNYNYRFVDQGNQLFAGITFDIFPPMEIK